MRPERMALLTLVGVLSLAALCGSVQAGDDDSYALMRPDRETRLRWLHDHVSAPQSYIDPYLASLIPERGSFSLLSHIQYTPSQRNQNWCGNCWVWAGTGAAEIALDLAGTHDRLSIQYLDSCDSSGWACCGGWLSDFASFYTGVDKVLPWTNTNASFQDGYRDCADGSSTVSCGSIATTPNYPVTTISNSSISTHGVGQTAAKANIKNVLHQNKGVWFAFYLANQTDWNTFFSFWNYNSESTIWSPDDSCGHTWVSGEGGGHAVLIVGYNDDSADPANHYWEVLNSWGTTASRPNGLFRMAMNMNYDCTYLDGGAYYSLYFENLNVTFGGSSCPDDGYETQGAGGTNDTCYGTPIAVGSTQTHLHCDLDWLYFNAIAGATYEIRTLNLIGGADTILELYSGCTTFIDSDDDGGGGVTSLITYTASSAGRLDVKVKEYNDAYANGEGYDIRVLCTANCGGETPLFADGFETGNTSSWSTAVP